MATNNFENNEESIKCMYVDLSNLFGGISEVFDVGVYMDFATLMPVLDDAFEGIDQFKVYGAYMSPNKDKPETYELVRSQNMFMNSAKLEGVEFNKGRIRNGREKAVDMMLGVDMVNDAHNQDFTDYILFSEDADFQRPVDIVKGLGKSFHYCAFTTRYSWSFAKQAQSTVVVDYNGSFRLQMTGKKMPTHNFTVKDAYKDRSVKIRSIEVAKT